MSESKSGSAAVKIILAIGFVLAVLMVIGFGGVFYLLKYNNEQEIRAEALERANRSKSRIARGWERSGVRWENRWASNLRRSWATVQTPRS